MCLCFFLGWTVSFVTVTCARDLFLFVREDGEFIFVNFWEQQLARDLKRGRLFDLEGNLVFRVFI